MHLETIAARFAEGLVAVDAATTHVQVNARTGAPYLPGVPSMNEETFVANVARWWHNKHPEDFSTDETLHTGVPYPINARQKCDLVVATQPVMGEPRAEWAVEVKRVQLVGDNGKNNDFGMAKLLSPYLKDRSLAHDVERLAAARVAPRQAVLLYGFEYGPATLRRARELHPGEASRIRNIEDVCRKNDPEGSVLSLRPLVRAVNAVLLADALVLGDPVVVEFKGAWKHPCGGDGLVCAWELAHGMAPLVV